MTSRLLLPASLLFAFVLPLGCGDDPKPKPPDSSPMVKAPEPPKSDLGSVPAGQMPGQMPGQGQLPAGHPSLDGGVDPATFRVSGANDDSAFMEVGGIKAPKPVAWTWIQPTMQFRTLQYTIPGAGDSTGSADLIVSVFVDGDGGPTDSNIDRWVNQFRTPDGKPITPKKSTKQVDGLNVILLELEGTYNGMGTPGPQADTKQFAAIIEGPRRRVFLRLLGPAKTVDAQREAWTALIEGIKDTAKPAK